MIEPRFVQWGYFEEDWEILEKIIITKNEKGEEVESKTNERKLKDNAQLKPVGVAYDRLVVPIIEKVKEHEEKIFLQQKEIEDLKLRLEKLESLLSIKQ